MKDYKIATWSRFSKWGDTTFLSNTHLTLDGETAICGRKIPVKMWQEQATVIGKPEEFVYGSLFYHDGSRALIHNTAIDLREAKCCSVCQKMSGGLLGFAVSSIVAFAEARTKAREEKRARIAARKEVA
jgi:hypothetical protein